MASIPLGMSASQASTERIRAFATGGTFDCCRIEEGGRYHFDQTHLPAMIERARLTVEVLVETICLKDSALMTTTDRALVAARCASCDETKIILGHGTDTVILTLEEITKRAKDKTIVAFGAFIPYVEGTASEALFNFGASVAAVQLLSPGAYLVANGHVFPWDRVRKDYETQEFKFL